ncbi:fused MFS/spermidine synthase, partial [Candidatus Bathyarchaeota archaeon]|nr:fused MFS/spermidine synthase [Candidatus Bathyarchaeota archaeon]
MPLLVRQFTPPDSSLNVATAWLYAINTFGAAIGCYMAGFHLLPSIGLFWSNIMAAVMNLTIGGLSIAIASESKLKRPQQRSPVFIQHKPARHRTEGHFSYSTVSLCFRVLAMGFASLVLQMVWIRQVSLIVGGSTYAFCAVLFVFLLGVGLGSLLFHLTLRKYSDLVHAPALVIFGVVVFTVVGYSLIPHLTFVMGLLRPLRSSQVFNAFSCVSVSSMLQLIPALGMGLLFPIFVHLTRMRPENVGGAVGKVYMWNTIGAIAGSLFAFTLLIPRLGTHGTIVFASILYLLALNTQFPVGRKNFVLLRTLLTLVCLAGVAFMVRQHEPRVTNLGMYLYGYDQYQADASSELLYFSEGASCNVLVLKHKSGNHSLRVNGKIDASSGRDMKTQLGLAYFPRLLKPSAKSIFCVGYGSGTTVGASLLYPDTHVTCCEIEPEVVTASKYFSG